MDSVTTSDGRHFWLTAPSKLGSLLTEHTVGLTPVQKDWGYEIWFANTPDYCGKLLHFNAGHACSWHYHKIKEETFYLASGRLELHYGWEDGRGPEVAKVIELNVGDSFHVPVGLRHQMVALEDSDLIEYSTHHEDSDSIRVEKGY